MKTYIVQWRYRSSIGGPWMKGDEVPLEPGLAERINIDSPGVLVEKNVETQNITSLPLPHLDRMVKKAKRRGEAK